MLQLLSKPKFSAIEKMKTVGSTYMAAAGLQPGRDMADLSSGERTLPTTKQVKLALCYVTFET